MTGEDIKFFAQFGITAVLLVAVMVWFAKQHLPMIFTREDKIRAEHDVHMARWWERHDEDADKRGKEFSGALEKMLNDSRGHHSALNSKIDTMQLSVDNVSKKVGEMEPKVNELHYDWKRKQRGAQDD